MAMKMNVKKYDSSAEFIVGNHYVNVNQMHPRATSEAQGQATAVGDRFVVTAGTLITKDAKPLGFCYRDVDVTEGDAMIAVTVHAVIAEAKLPVELTQEDKEALKGIVFV